MNKINPSRVFGPFRSVERILEGREVTDGDGVRIRRLLTGKWQKRLDPWLMLDIFRSHDPRDYIGGFPDHPHRGFETITVMFSGRMLHKDSAGHEGLLESGGVQWMIAGRGVIHSEMPQQQNGLMEGVQLWLNLPAAEKMSPPWYRDFQSHEIPEYRTQEDVSVRVIAGESHGIKGAMQRPVTQPLYLDIHLPAGRLFDHHLPVSHHAFIVVVHGEIEVEGDEAGAQCVRENELAILDQNSAAIGATGATGVRFRAKTESRLLLIAGCPLGEPIVSHGPFVMNTEKEIQQAFVDYRSGRFGQ